MNAKWMAVIGIGLLAVQVSAGEKRTLKTQKDKESYAMAVGLAKSIQRQHVEIDVKVFAKGLDDALSGRKLLLTEDELHAAMSGVVDDLKQKDAEAAKSRREAGARFLAENAKKEGVVTLPSGLQYEILDAGNGDKPSDADTVQCHFSATFIDGREFDSSRRRGKPATFKVAKVVPGLKEALKLMPVGSRWRLFLPPELAYGPRGGSRKSKIRPNETLVYEVQILAILHAAPPASTSEKTAAASPVPETRGE